MFRDDVGALAQQNEELRREVERLREESAAMGRALLAIQRGDHPELVPTPATLYRGDLTGLPDGLRAAYARHTLAPTPAWQIALLHVLTFGISSVVHFARVSERLPMLSQDDAPALKAALGFFIPYYNLYWLFAFPLRLTDRINLQFRLRGREPELPRAMAIAAGVVTIPLYFLFPLAWLVPAWRAQRAINALCALPPPALASSQAGAQGSAEYTGVRVDPAAEDAPGGHTLDEAVYAPPAESAAESVARRG